VPLLTGRSSRPSTLTMRPARGSPPVHDKVNEFMTWYSSVHRGAVSRARSRPWPTMWPTTCRLLRGRRSATNTVIFGKNTQRRSTSWPPLSAGSQRRRPLLADGTSLQRSALAPPGTAVPYRVRDDGSFDEEDYDRLLRQHAGRVRLVAISGASNVTGTSTDPPLAKKAHDVGP